MSILDFTFAIVLIRALHKKLESALAGGGVAFARGLWRIVRLRVHFVSGSERELSGNHHRFVRLHAVLDYSKIAVLSLAGFHRAKIDRVVRLQHKNERTALADLDCLLRNKPRVFDRVENETDADKFRRPERAIRIRRDRARFNSSGTRLHGVEARAVTPNADRAL